MGASAAPLRPPTQHACTPTGLHRGDPIADCPGVAPAAAGGGCRRQAEGAHGGGQRWRPLQALLLHLALPALTTGTLWSKRARRWAGDVGRRPLWRGARSLCRAPARQTVAQDGWPAWWARFRSARPTRPPDMWALAPGPCLLHPADVRGSGHGLSARAGAGRAGGGAAAGAGLWQLCEWASLLACRRRAGPRPGPLFLFAVC